MRQMSEIITLLKRHKGFRSNSEVARALNMTAQSLHNHVNRGTVPEKQIVEYAVRENLNLNWLLDGTEELSEPEEKKEIAVIMDFIKKYPKERSKLYAYVVAQLAALNLFQN